jgi:hypothetical protein
MDHLIKKIDSNFFWLQNFQSRCREPLIQKKGQKKMRQIKHWLTTAWEMDKEYVCEKRENLATFYYVNIEHREAIMVTGFNENMREHCLLEKSLSEKGIDTEKLLRLFPAESLNIEKPFMMIVPAVQNVFAEDTLKQFGHYILNQSRDLSVLKEMATFVGLITE